MNISLFVFDTSNPLRYKLEILLQNKLSKQFLSINDFASLKEQFLLYCDFWSTGLKLENKLKYISITVFLKAILNPVHLSKIISALIPLKIFWMCSLKVNAKKWSCFWTWRTLPVLLLCLSKQDQTQHLNVLTILERRSKRKS